MKKISISLLLTLLLLSVFAVTDAFCLTFYVDTSTGKDNSSWGVKPDKPWKTIAYAVQQTSMIETYEEVLINVAAGTYNETVNINIRPISLEGTGADTIIDGGSQDVITIDGVQKVAIRGFTIQNGNDGFIGKRGSAFEVSDTTAQDCSDNGIQVDENSTLQISDCTVLRSGNSGIVVSGSSNLKVIGNCSILDNMNRGIANIENSSVSLQNGLFTIQRNKSHGILTGNSSSLKLSNAEVYSSDNSRDGVIIVGSSRLFLADSKLFTQNNDRYGIALVGTSHAGIPVGSEVVTSSNTSTGMVVTQSSGAEISGVLCAESNGNIGMRISVASGVSIFGKVDILNNHDKGIDIGSSEVFCGSSTSNLTVSGTSGGYGTGIFMCDNALLRSYGKLLVENNKDGSLNCGIYVCRNSTVSLFPNSSTDAKIQNNASHGIAVHLNSVGRFERDVSISGNTENGVRLLQNGLLWANGTVIYSNGGSGILARDGSSVHCRNCNITGNFEGDVRLEWASRSELTGGSVGSVVCDDNTVLTRGDHVCSP